MKRLSQSSERDPLLKEAQNPGFFAEYWNFLRTSRKWWMLPLLILFFVLGVILVLGQTAVAPFIYTLF
jgi:hypothetical protein